MASKIVPKTASISKLGLDTRREAPGVDFGSFLAFRKAKGCGQPPSRFPKKGGGLAAAFLELPGDDF